MDTSNSISLSKNVSLAEPFTDVGRDALQFIKISASKIHVTESDFFNQTNGMFVEPFSIYQKPLQEEKNDDPDINLDYSDIIDLNELNFKKEQFEENFKTLTEDSLFMIKGVAGSGKTTYLHYLKYKLQDTTQFHIIDFEKFRPANSFMGTSFQLKEYLYKYNIYKFISATISEISELLKKGGSTDEKHRNFIKEILITYKNFFQVLEVDLPSPYVVKTNIDIEEQQMLFDILRKYSEGKTNYSYSECSEELKNLLLEEIDSKEKNKDEAGIGIAALSYVAGFLIRLYFCLSQINSKRYVFAVDNIEVFVKFDSKNPVQECELGNIVDACIRSTKEMRNLLDTIIGEKNYNPFYGFLLVTRDTTISSALNSDHRNDISPTNTINISSWFCTLDIYAKKKKFFVEKGVKMELCPYAKAYEYILDDSSEYRWNLSDMISKMYKNSHRRKIECISDALVLIPKEDIEYFNMQWEKTINRVGNAVTDLKTVCRKYIIRILLDHAQRANFLNLLINENTGISGIKKRTLEHKDEIINHKPISVERNSYARKIVTMLHRFSIEHDNETFVSFPRLINSILKKPYLAYVPSNDQIKSLARAIFLMNETKYERTNWTSLVTLKYDNKKVYNEGNLYSIMQEQWNKWVVDGTCTSEYGIKITEAGSFFAKIMPEFEYFACRFLSSEPPLFSVRNIRKVDEHGKVTNDGSGQFRAIEIIKVIRQKAFKCSSDIIQMDSEFFASMQKKGTPIDFSPMFGEYGWAYKESVSDSQFRHPERIYNQHIGYINHYKRYIEEYVAEEEFEKIKGGKKEDKKSFLDLLAKEYEEYNKQFEQLKKANPSYFS